MNKKKVLIRLAQMYGILVIFFVAVLILYHMVSYFPYDDIAITYIRNNAEIEEQYGEIVSIYRNRDDKYEDEEKLVHTPYLVTTEKVQFTAHFIFSTENGKLEMVKMNIKDIVEIENVENKEIDSSND